MSHHDVPFQGCRQTLQIALSAGAVLLLAACSPAPRSQDVPRASSPPAIPGGEPARPTTGSPQAVNPQAVDPMRREPVAGDPMGGAAADPITAPVAPGDVIEPENVAGPPAKTLAFEDLRSQVEKARGMDASGALAAYESDLATDLSYDPTKSAHLDVIQGSALAVSDAELAVFGDQGVVISTEREFPTFVRGLAAIYSEHLPLYVSADALLEPVHASYDQILLALEEAVLIPDLRALLSGMRDQLAHAEAWDPATRADADLYLAVAASLLEGTSAAAVAGAAQAQIDELTGMAIAASGLGNVELFGQPRVIDFSQFSPRGHYTGRSPELENYFRAMMWLGRIDLRLIETLPNGEQVFRPEQYRASLLLADLTAAERDRWTRIDETVRTFVGESDYMVVPEVDALVADLGGLSAARNADKDQVVAALVAGDYGAQQIASHFMVNDMTVETLPLNRSFLVFGQRYIVDSHVFSEVTYDRIPRMMPTPLDAAFAALGNDQALSLIGPELHDVPKYAGALAGMRVVVDAHDQDFWNKNFYNLWLSALRALSPDAESPDRPDMPEVARTDAFGRRVLNTQLASWAQLRHDTLLYAKQSYTGVPGCEFPDVYVDPYPAFFRALERYAAAGQRIVELAAEPLGAGSPVVMGIANHFDALESTSRTLAEMAEHQLRGEPFTVDHMAFINRAVRIETVPEGCVTVEVPDGWYADLFFDANSSLAFDPTIADVHTQPADEEGNIVGRVLHVGTGYPRLMLVSIDTCEGPKAYAGIVYAYHEQITEDFDRLTDERWSQGFGSPATRPADAAWLSPVTRAAGP